MSKVKAVCTWGDGPDVLLCVGEDPKNFFDLTLEEAKELESNLSLSILQVEHLERVYKELMTSERVELHPLEKENV